MELSWPAILTWSAAYLFLSAPRAPGSLVLGVLQNSSHSHSRIRPGPASLLVFYLCWLTTGPGCPARAGSPASARLIIMVLPRLTAFHTICGRSCTGFLFPNASTSLSLLWSGGASWSRQALTCRSSTAPSRPAVVAVSFALLPTVIWLFPSPAQVQCSIRLSVMCPVTWNGLHREVHCLL